MKKRVIFICTLAFAIVGGVLLAFAMRRVSFVLPGLGIVVIGSLVGFVVGAIFGAVLGLIVGFAVSRRYSLK